MANAHYRQNGDSQSPGAGFAAFAILLLVLTCGYLLASFTNSILETRAVVSDSQFPGRFLDYFRSHFSFLYAGLAGVAGYLAILLFHRRGVPLHLFFGFILTAGFLLIAFSAPTLILTSEQTLERWKALFEDYPDTPSHWFCPGFPSAPSWFCLWRGFDLLLGLVLLVVFELQFIRWSRKR